MDDQPSIRPLFGEIAKQYIGKQALAVTNSAPSAPTATAASGTALGIGAYKYKITFVSANGESTGGTEASVTTTSNNQDVNLTVIPTGPTGTTARNVYRTAVGGATGTELFVATIVNNTATTYADTTPDASLGVAIPTVNTFNQTIVALETVTSGKTLYITDILLSTDVVSTVQFMDNRLQAAGVDIFRAMTHSLLSVDMPGIQTPPVATTGQAVTLLLPALASGSGNVFYFISGFEQ